MLYATYHSSPIGTMLLMGTEKAMVGIWFEGQTTFPDAFEIRDDLPLFKTVKNWLSRYFAGENPDPAEVPLELRGTAFRREVWHILTQIPYGQTVSYGQIADLVAKRQGRAHMSAQAVGGAIGHNPVSVIVPCHRVVGADGSLTGYAGGLWRKEFLLQLEQNIK